MFLLRCTAVDLNAWPLLDRGTYRLFAGEVTLRIILARSEPRDISL